MSDSSKSEQPVQRRAAPILWSPDGDSTPAPSAKATNENDRVHERTSTKKARKSVPHDGGSRIRQKPKLKLVDIAADTVGSDPDADLSSVSPVRYSVAMKDVPKNERPRERFLHLGAAALSTAELIAILMRTGTTERSVTALAEQLLSELGGLSRLAEVSVAELESIHGIGTVKAIEIKTAIELGHRVSTLAPEYRPTIGGPQDVSNLLQSELRYLKKETLKSILLDAKNKVIAVKTVSIGDLTSSIVHPREVYRDAIVHSSASIIVAHNHPSGDPTPSTDDVNITRRLIAAGETIGIELLDHIVIGDDKFVSLKEKGLI